MQEEKLYGNFTKTEMDEYTKEAEQKWGHTEAFKQSQERVKKMGAAGLTKVIKEAGELTLFGFFCIFIHLCFSEIAV